ncbi:MAG: zinc-ribbon domain-containing protein [Chloroflexi bacterium]|nr:zinc-ribbon domain-containing protein [Chloroflexota bacterium]
MDGTRHSCLPCGVNVDTLATCGEEAEILATREVSVYCTYCGVQNPDNANFCSSCGKELVAQSAEPQPQVHHPWMTAQEPPEQPQAQSEEQGKGVCNLI